MDDNDFIRFAGDLNADNDYQGYAVETFDGAIALVLSEAFKEDPFATVKSVTAAVACSSNL